MAYFEASDPLVDIPTTLLASGEAIDRTLDSRYIGPNKDRDILEKREIHNFKKTLENLKRKDYGEDPPYLKIVGPAPLKRKP